MACKILVLNIGSTSFKFKYFNMDDLSVIASGKINSVFSKNAGCNFLSENTEKSTVFDASDGCGACLEMIIDFIDKNCADGKNGVSAIGFKTVMAGEINYPCIIDDAVIEKMQEYSTVAPAHNTPYIEAVKSVRKYFPNVTLVASFETAFHNTIPDFAAVYPIDKDIAKKYGIRKYGFHGAAHSYAAYKFGSEKNIVSVHLGGSSSVCAIKGGKSVDVSMGFSPQSGLPMNNRCGDIDVFAVLYLMEKENMSIDDAQKFLCTKCGLYGMSGISNDLRDIEKANDTLVIDAFTYSVSKYICSYLAVLGKIDVISFSGGIGENSVLVKEKICSRLKFLGVELDSEKLKHKPAGEPYMISSDKSKVEVYITPVDEELMVAKNTYAFAERR